MGTIEAQRMVGLVDQLIGTWHEKVEHEDLFIRHSEKCREYMARLAVTNAGLFRHFNCNCPADTETRVGRYPQNPLLVQLVTSSDGYNPVGVGGGGKAGPSVSKPPGSLYAVNLIGELGRLCAEHGAQARTLASSLRRLVSLALENSPEWSDAVASELSGHVKSARIFLGYDVPTKTLAETFCGDCGGTLAVAADASSDVRCIGTAEAPECGKVYPQHQWALFLR